MINREYLGCLSHLFDGYEERYRDFGLDMAILQNAFADTLEGLKKRKYPWETEWFLR